MKYVVNSFEIFLYYCVWSAAITYSFYSLFHSQTDILQKNPYLRLSLRDLSPGWTFLDREKDTADIEWSCWKYSVQTSWPYLFFQFMVSEILRQSNIPAVKYWYIISSIFFLTIRMGIRHVLMIVIQPIAFFILLLCGGKQISIWITSLTLLLIYNSLKYKYFFWNFLDDGSPQEEKIFILLFSVAWMKLRCISYCLDYLERHETIGHPEKKTETTWQIFINMFSYVLYLPLLYLGPIVLYEEFEKSFQYKSDKLWTRLKRFLFDIILYLIYAFLLEFTFHFIYFYAMHSELQLIEQLPTLALAGGGLWMGFEFLTKYVISYGSTTAFARLDNMDTPPTPRCIARIHVYSLMWKYFDVGLYKFLVKYIYKPSYTRLCKFTKVTKIVYKLIASFLTFAFIYLWHGTTMNILIWCIFNYIGILLESIGKGVSVTSSYKTFKDKVLKTDAMEVRFIAALCAPLLAMSAISNFFLFGGTDIGYMYVKLLDWPAPHNLMFVLLSTYCCCHISMSLLDVPSRTDVKRTKVKIDY